MSKKYNINSHNSWDGHGPVPFELIMLYLENKLDKKTRRMVEAEMKKSDLTAEAIQGYRSIANHHEIKKAHKELLGIKFGKSGRRKSIVSLSPMKLASAAAILVLAGFTYWFLNNSEMDQPQVAKNEIVGFDSVTTFKEDFTTDSVVYSNEPMENLTENEGNEGEGNTSLNEDTKEFKEELEVETPIDNVDDSRKEKIEAVEEELELNDDEETNDNEVKALKSAPVLNKPELDAPRSSSNQPSSTKTTDLIDAQEINNNITQDANISRAETLPASIDTVIKLKTESPEKDKVTNLSDQDSLQLHFVQGKVLYLNNKFKEASIDFERYLTKGGKEKDEVEWMLSQCYLQMGEKELSNKLLNKIANSNSPYSEQAKRLLNN